MQFGQLRGMPQIHNEEDGVKSKHKARSDESISSSNGRFQVLIRSEEFYIELKEVKKLQVLIRSRRARGSGPTQRVANLKRETVETQFEELPA